MIIHGITVDNELASIKKSIAENLSNKNNFTSVNTDTADQSLELHPPVSMRNCYYVFKESSNIAKCCRILADDIIYNTITLTPSDIEPSEHLINQVTKINELLDKQIDELHNLLIDYYYAGWAALEYTWNNTEFKIQQIPIHTCSIIRVNVNGESVYLLKQQINSTTRYFKIMGETYPETFNRYANQLLNYASLLGGDNIYQFFSLPRWIQHYDEILTEIAIKKNDYKTVANGNISSGVLNIHLGPQTGAPIKYDVDGKPVQTETRQEIITNELKSANGGTAVLFDESPNPLGMDYVSLTNNNQSYLTQLKYDSQQSTLNDYEIPLARLMINTEKESMNSDKTKSIWEIYTLNLRNKQKPVKQFIQELLYELYSLELNVEISTPIFSDRRETEIQLHSTAWNDGAINLKQYVTALSEFLPVIDLNNYDFSKNPELWEYRKIPELESGLSSSDLELIESIEAQLK